MEKKKNTGLISVNTLSNAQSIFWATTLGNDLLPDFIANSNFMGDVELAAGIGIVLNYLLVERTTKFTREISTIKDSYDLVIDNTAKLIKELKSIDPVEIFAIYNYMLRNGYLSCDKFYFSAKSKDTKVLGADVINGYGVCRNISSMLTDIYNDLGYEAYNLVVHAKRETIGRTDSISGTRLNKEKVNGVRKMFSIPEIVALPNHQINLVGHNDHTFIMDPTNDCLLNPFDEKTIVLADDEDYSMEVNFGSSVLAGTNSALDKNKIKELLNGYSNSKSSRYNSYVHGLEKATENEQLLNDFKENNMDLYINIQEELDRIPSLLAREFISWPKNINWNKILNKSINATTRVLTKGK